MKHFTKLGLIVLAVFFSQVYPFVHFHHDHEDATVAREAGSILQNVSPHHAHHGHDHDSSHEPADNHGHDHEFSQHVDWHIIRTHSSSILSHIEFAFISVQFDTDPTQTSSPRYYRAASAPLPDSAVLDGIDPRGPPALG